MPRPPLARLLSRFLLRRSLRSKGCWPVGDGGDFVFSPQKVRNLSNEAFFHLFFWKSEATLYMKNLKVRSCRKALHAASHHPLLTSPLYLRVIYLLLPRNKNPLPGLPANPYPSATRPTSSLLPPPTPPPSSLPCCRPQPSPVPLSPAPPPRLYLVVIN